MVVFPALSSPTKHTLNSLNVKRRRHSDDMSRPIGAVQHGAAQATGGGGTEGGVRCAWEVSSWTRDAMWCGWRMDRRSVPESSSSVVSVQRGGGGPRARGVGGVVSESATAVSLLRILLCVSLIHPSAASTGRLHRHDDRMNG